MVVFLNDMMGLMFDDDDKRTTWRPYIYIYIYKGDDSLYSFVFLFIVSNPKIVNMMNFGFLGIVRSINVASFKKK